MSQELVFVLIIIFAFVMPIVVVGMWNQHKKEMHKMNAELGKSETQNLKNELAAVKSRLEVLEAIVTDKKYQLNEEIGRLKESDTRIN